MQGGTGTPLSPKAITLFRWGALSPRCLVTRINRMGGPLQKTFLGSPRWAEFPPGRDRYKNLLALSPRLSLGRINVLGDPLQDTPGSKTIISSALTLPQGAALI